MTAKRGAAQEPTASLNERQEWILGEIERGVRLELRDIVRHARMNRSTANRDLKELRERGLIALHDEGHYIPGEKGAPAKIPL